MEKPLRCVLLLSLEDMALRKVAVLLWSGSDVSTSIAKFRSFGYSNESLKKWKETIEGKVKDEMLKLDLHESLKKKMADIISPIGLQIKRRKLFIEEFEDEYQDEYQASLPHAVKLCWTTSGAIDYRETAKELISCDRLDAAQRYMVACIYCLEDDIPLLWEKLPEATKDYFCNKKPTSPYPHFYWPHLLKGEFSKLDCLLKASTRNPITFNQLSVEYVIESYNKTAVEYFFRKLTHEERGTASRIVENAIITEPFRMPHCSHLSFLRKDILCFLLSVMSAEQQMEIIKMDPVQVWLWFLDWPRQDLFLENADLIWAFLPPSKYGKLLSEMADRFNVAGHYFPTLFRKFFVQSPDEFKKYFVYRESGFDNLNTCDFLPIFLESGDSESIQIVFRNVDAEDRVKFLFYNLSVFYDSILSDRWPMVKLCLEEATLSPKDRQKWMEELIELYSKDFERMEWKNRQLRGFFKFIDEIYPCPVKAKKSQSVN